MAGMCIYEPLNGSLPNCDGICKREDACCAYYYEYEKQYEKAKENVNQETESTVYKWANRTG